MKKMTSLEIRQMWLDFFKSKGHQIVESAPLIPKDDDSLLWINAGVTPLKKYFDGSIVPENRRITNIQKCIRTNDIENVGVTRRHHTFFEMMGNFSIGDYFKSTAIEYAFELLTGKQWFDIPLDKLYFTVYPNDLDTYNKWISLGVSKNHIIKLEDNFWEIGEGPCGPDTEIFYDRGSKYDKDKNALEKFKNGEDNERFVEIWNNVFSQFNSKEGVPREKYKELPNKNIDTGAGIERWACIFQDADSNFDTDLFLPTIKQIEEMSGTLYDGSIPYKVLADHIRALTFALADGANFDNVGRGYILRRLLRRSVRYGRKLGLSGLFIYKLVDSVVLNMKDVYPYLLNKQAHVKALIMTEEELFLKTLDKGLKKIKEMMDESLDNTISGKDAFKLYDTYGFPFELTLEYLEENNFTTSKTEFLECMNQQKEMSKNNQKQTISMKSQNELLLNFKDKSEFLYDVYQNKGTVISLINDNQFVKTISKEGLVVFDKTCFYALSGGQISDTGMIIGDNFKARVVDVFKGPNSQHIHKVKILSGKIKLLDKCELIVDKTRRENIEANHSSVHLLQFALQNLIDKNIYQAGSKVLDNQLRFDFNYHGKIDDDKLIEVENLVNEYIKQELPRITTLKDFKDIKKEDVMALFTEKYHDKVRLVEIGKSKELCGGSHVKNTKDIKEFSIISFINKGANTYRITATTKENIEQNLLEAIKPYQDELVKQIMKAKNIVSLAKKDGFNLNLDIVLDNNKPKRYKDIVDIKNRLNYVTLKVHELEKEYNRLKEIESVSNLDIYEKDLLNINSYQVIISKVDNMDSNIVKNIIDSLANKYNNSLIIFFIQSQDNLSYIIRSNSSLKASKYIKLISENTNGKGGGSDKFAQGGTKNYSNISELKKNIIDGIKNE